jgi:endonuclease III
MNTIGSIQRAVYSYGSTLLSLPKSFVHGTYRRFFRRESKSIVRAVLKESSRGLAAGALAHRRTVGVKRQQHTSVSAVKALKSMKKVVEKPVSINVRTNEATLRPKASEIAKRLNILYPNPPIPLHHESGFQLLCAVVLSAQTTDLKVNEVTPELFSMGPDAKAMSACDVKDIERVIGTLGLAPTKAKNLKALSLQLVTEHSGIVPKTFEELEALPGVGHKTASVVMSQVHGKPSFPVDTHIHRLAQRWGLTDGSSVEQTEADLKFLFDKDSWNDLHLQIIYFGRELCPARGHDPATCPICSWAAVHPYNTFTGTQTTKSPNGKKRNATMRAPASKKRAKKL